MNKPFCPILLIGFPAPKKGEEDIRKCTSECALYDTESAQCSIVTCCEVMTEIQDSLYDMATGFYPVEDDYNDNFDYNPNTIGKA